MNLDILPLAITMMVGPQIMSAIIFLTTSKPVKISTAFLAGVAIATIVGLVVLLTVVSLLGNGVSLGEPSKEVSIGKLIQYVLVGLLVALAVKNYLRRETVEPPRWLGALQSADWKRALMTGVLVIWLMPGDIIVMLTVGVNLVHNDAGLVAALPFIGATLLVAALPLLLYLLFHRRAQRLMPRVRGWMNTHSWLLNIITCVVFIALILWRARLSTGLYSPKCLEGRTPKFACLRVYWPR
jgi:threonine/homoserine/homoserine lactone efflux protein